MSSTSSPACSCWPWSSWSSVTVRRMLRIGVTQRMNSSTAVVAEQLGSVDEQLALVGLQRELAEIDADDRAGGLGAAVEQQQAS